jgi:hypothetical protein
VVTDEQQTEGRLRNTIFRILAGLLAATFAAVLLFSDNLEMSLARRVTAWVLTFAFAAFSILGNDIAASKLLTSWFGFGQSVGDDQRKP